MTISNMNIYLPFIMVIAVVHETEQLMAKRTHARARKAVDGTPHHEEGHPAKGGI
jgi:hypothetical protein